jgi:hypothetical protein
MVATTHYPHQRQEDYHHHRGLRKANQKASHGHTGDAYGNQYAGPNAIGKPSRRQLADAV